MVDHAFTVPDALKIRGREQKHILREAAKGLLPAEILRRPKGLLRLARDRRFSDVARRRWRGSTWRRSACASAACSTPPRSRG